jgi:hypothetical protein
MKYIFLKTDQAIALLDLNGMITTFVYSHYFKPYLSAGFLSYYDENEKKMYIYSTNETK